MDARVKPAHDVGACGPRARLAETPMPKITYIEHDGSRHTVDAEIGSTVMETALRNDIASIVAECGGSCTCSTCLVHVDEKWFEVDGPPSAEDEEQLEIGVLGADRSFAGGSREEAGCADAVRV